MVRVRRVVGESMLPTLHSGQIIVVKHMRVYRVGDIVMVLVDGLEVVKRIQRSRSGEYYVVGDNAAASTDSRTFGWVTGTQIRGKIVWPRS